MRIRDWSSDVCSSDLTPGAREVLEILDLRIVCVEQHRQADERPDAAHVDTAARFGPKREQRAGAAAGEVDIAGEQRVGDRPAAAQLHHLNLDAVDAHRFRMLLEDSKSVVQGKRVSVRVYLGGRRINKKKK